MTDAKGLSDLEEKARAIVNSTKFIIAHDPEGFSIDHDVLIKAITQALREVRETDAKAVRELMGKDSGNWNRAITYAVDAIREGVR